MSKKSKKKAPPQRQIDYSVEAQHQYEDGVGQITGWEKGLPVIENGLSEFKLCPHCQHPLEPVDGLCYNQACPQYWDKGTAPFREEFKLCSTCLLRRALEDGRCEVCFAPDGSENPY